MLHEEFYINYIDDVQKSLEGLPGTTEQKIRMLNLVVNMSIANSLEVIADSLSPDCNDSGVTDTLNSICSAIHTINR